MTAPNQRNIVVKHTLREKAGRINAVIDKDSLLYACNTLSPRAFKRWVTMMANATDFHVWSGPVASRTVLHVNLGATRNPYAQADQELIDKGFLVPARDGTNTWHMVEKEAPDDYGLYDREKNPSSNEDVLKRGRYRPQTRTGCPQTRTVPSSNEDRE